MSPICYLRVFDLDKYREIEPVIKGIYDKNADPFQVTSLIQEALMILETYEFKQYNNTNSSLNEIYTYYLENALSLITADHLSEWPDSNSNSTYQDSADYIMPYFVESITYENYLLETVSSNTIDLKLSSSQDYISCDEVLRIVTLLLCCPKYQNSIKNNTNLISDFTIEYTNVYATLYIYNENICNLLESGSSGYLVENMPFNQDMRMLKFELLSILTDIVSKDLSSLLQPDSILYLIRDMVGTPYRFNMLSKSNSPTNLDDGDSFTSELYIQSELIDFYRSLKMMLDLINKHSNYVILNEILF